jgi:hypothetical protein
VSSKADTNYWAQRRFVKFGTTARHARGRAISIKSADSWRAKSENYEKFLVLMIQGLSSKPFVEAGLIFASNEQVGLIMEAMIIAAD